MFVRDRIKIIYSLNIHLNFYKGLIDGDRETIDFLDWDKELHFYSLNEILKELYSSREGHPWSNAEEDYLMQLLKEGKGSLDISKELNRSRDSIRNKMLQIEMEDINYDLVGRQYNFEGTCNGKDN